jgi:hypothetical protein
LKLLRPKPLDHRAVVQVVRANLGSRWSRIWGFLAWRLRPKFLKHYGKAVRLRWWICYWLIQRLDPKTTKLLNEGRALMFANHTAGRSSREWMRGKAMANKARLNEARIAWLAMEGGTQYTDGSSDIELTAFGPQLVSNIRKAR